jgi:hypothetical protein
VQEQVAAIAREADQAMGALIAITGVTGAGAEVCLVLAAQRGTGMNSGLSYAARLRQECGDATLQVSHFGKARKRR